MVATLTPAEAEQTYQALLSYYDSVIITHLQTHKKAETARSLGLSPAHISNTLKSGGILGKRKLALMIIEEYDI